MEIETQRTEAAYLRSLIYLELELSLLQCSFPYQYGSFLIKVTGNRSPLSIAYVTQMSF